jgi:hypothetical protein
VRAWARLEGDAIVQPQLGIVSDEHKKKLRRKYDEMFASILARDGVVGNFDWRSSEVAENPGTPLHELRLDFSRALSQGIRIIHRSQFGHSIRVVFILCRHQHNASVPEPNTIR